MNDSASAREQTHGLERLNETERRVLLLLAEGHTAKSIASALGCTEAAVNERLREARRKTGVGSSREVARLLKAQESRDEQMGVVRRLHRGAIQSPADAEPWRPQIGVIAMFLFISAALAAAAAMNPLVDNTGSAAAEPTLTDDQLGTIPKAGSAWLYPMLRQEERDSAWAADAEKALRGRYASKLFFGHRPQLLRITCARTLCEVAAAYAVPEPDSSYTMDVAMVAELKKAGLLHAGEIITSPVSGKPRGVYLAYYMRSASKVE